MRGFFTQVVYNNNYNIIAMYLFYVENIVLDPRYSILEMHIKIIHILGEGSHFMPFCYFKFIDHFVSTPPLHDSVHPIDI